MNARYKQKIRNDLPDCCSKCGCSEPLFLEVDHIVPTSRGGDSSKGNLQILCIMCNRLKGPLLEDEFQLYAESLRNLKKLNKISVTGQLTVNFYPNNIPRIREVKAP